MARPASSSSSIFSSFSSHDEKQQYQHPLIAIIGSIRMMLCDSGFPGGGVDRDLVGLLLLNGNDDDDATDIMLQVVFLSSGSLESKRGDRRTRIRK